MVCNLVLIFSIFFGALSAYSQIPEYELKSVLMLKMINFIEWPESYENEKDEFVISVLGQNPFGKYLDHTFENIKIKDKEVIIRYIKDHNDIAGSDVLFIARSERSNIDDILMTVNGKPILTIGDTIGFGEKGVHINFFVEKSRIRFYINESSAGQNGLEIDYHLRNVAKRIFR